MIDKYDLPTSISDLLQSNVYWKMYLLTMLCKANIR